MRKSLFISTIVVLSAIVAGSVRAALLGVSVTPPVIVYANTGSLTTSYNPISQIFSVTTTPSTIKFSPTEPTFSILSPRSMTIKIQVDNTGALVGGVPGPDLVISGRVQRVVGTVTNTYIGLLLTGEVTAFGYQDSGTTVDNYDFRFTPTGGLLAPFFACDHIGVTLVSEGSTFIGIFLTPFNGQSKGNVGLEDTTAPSITCPFDSTVTNVECSAAGGQSGAYVTFPNPIASDNCDTNVLITCSPTNGSFFALSPGTNMTSYTVTCMAVDASGNSTNCSFTITVVDNLPPEFDSPFIDACNDQPLTLPTVPSSCSATFTFQKPTAMDSCCTSSVPVSVSAIDENGFIIVLTESTSNGIVYVTGSFPQSCVGSNVITSTANDGRGNTTQAQCALYVFDNQPPSIDCGTNQTVGCTNGPVFYAVPLVSDNCTNVTFFCSPTNGSFLAVGVYTVTCTAIDGCGGNSNSCTFTLNVVDVTPPSIVCPSNVTVECNQPTDPSNTGSATATDDCDPNPSVSSTDSTSGVCPSYIYRTWIAVDHSGNSNQCTQVITVVDTTPPVIFCPVDRQQLQCGDSTDPSNTGSATATDTCSAVTITYTDTPTEASCSGKPGITRRWTATDACSNSVSCIQHISFVDTTAPVITCPADKQLQCGASTDPSNTGSASATDDCGGTPAISFTDSPTASNCTGRAGIARIWKALDGCHNSATCTQFISFVDTTAPVITCPADKQLQCGASTAPSNTGSASATDNCGGAIAITYTDAATASNCTGRTGIARAWKAMDGCGNSATCTQMITFVDTTAPVITCPADKQLQCGASTAPSNTGSASATDNCGGAIAITYTDAATAANCTGRAGIARAWKAMDGCGNSATCTQMITFVDTTAPTISCPGSITVQCDSLVPPPNAASVTASDNCGGAVNVTFVNDVANGTCPKTITRTYKATDGCGNSNTCTQTIIVNDTTPPSLTVPAGGDLGCSPTNLPTDASIKALVTVSDNCGAVTTTVTHVDTNINCTATRTFTVTAKDGCNNTTTKTVVYTYGCPVCQPFEFNFQGNSALSGAVANVRTYITNGVSVKVTAWSRTKPGGVWQTAYLGSYVGGLGVTDTSEGDGSGNQHTIDNVGRDNYVLFEFSQPVALSRAYLGYVVTDSDLQLWIGTFTDPYNNHLTLSDAVLGGFGYSEINMASNGATRWANLNAGATIGNAILVAALPQVAETNDQFKIALFDVCKRVCQPLAVGCAGNSGQVNVAYSSALVASGGNPPYTYMISSGSLPPGLTLNPSTGAITGTPTTAGAYGYTAKVTDSLGATAFSSGCTITIANPCMSSICGTVFLDCDGNGDLNGNEPGLSNSVVTLKTTNGTVLATATTDMNGKYCFNNLSAGAYVLSNAPNSFVESGGTCTNHWSDSNGRDCWYDLDHYTHFRSGGTNCWVAGDGYTHWKDCGTGMDTWKDGSGKTHTQTCHSSCDDIVKSNTITVVIGTCQNKTGVNFAQKAVAPKITCTVSCPSSCKHGSTVTYTCKVTNSGNACFSKGCKVNIWGSDIACPNLKPNESCTVTKTHTCPSSGSSLTCTVTGYGYHPTGTVTCTASFTCTLTN